MRHEYTYHTTARARVTASARASASAPASAPACDCKSHYQLYLLTNYHHQISRLNENRNVGRNENVNIISKTE